MTEPKPVKLIEIKDADWMKGISKQKGIALGGLFQKAPAFDPFKKMGSFTGGSTPTKRGSGIVTSSIEFFVPSIESNFAYTYGFVDGNILYKIKLSDSSVTDISAQIANITTIRGAKAFNNRMIYANDTNAFANTFPPLLANQTTLFSAGVIVAGDHIFETAPDKNLYMTNVNHVARITAIDGVTGNDGQYLTFKDDIIIRDLTNDGTHLVIVGDNVGSGVAGSQPLFDCFVAFWNMKSQDLTAFYEFKDQRVYAAKKSGTDVIIIGGNNIYKCNVGTPPTAIMALNNPNSSFVNDDTTFFFPTPSTPRQFINVDSETIYMGGRKGKVLAYGRPSIGLEKIFYHPFNISSQNITGMFLDGNDLWTADEGPNLYETSVTAITGTSSIVLAGIDFLSPYKFSYAKVILGSRLASGQSVDIEIMSDNGDNTVMRNTKGTTYSFSYTNFGKKKSHIFYPYPGATSASTIALFEDLSKLTLINTGADVTRLEIWGIPIPPKQVTT